MQVAAKFGRGWQLNASGGTTVSYTRPSLAVTSLKAMIRNGQAHV